jgi:putative transposase
LYDISQVTIVKQAGMWFAILSCKTMRRKQCSLNGEKTVGIDVGTKNYVYDSDGGHKDNPLFLTKELKPLRRAQRITIKLYHGCRSLHMRIANKRKDLLHKLSNEYRAAGMI